MIQNKRIILATFIAFLLFTSCVKEDIYNTPHPQHGKITLVTDWSKRGDGIAIPQNYTVQVSAYATTLTGERNVIKNLFLPDTYHLLIFNTPEKITINEAKASVASTKGDYIESQPGWLFSYNADIGIEKDRDYTFTATVEQQVRELNLWIEPTGGTISKIASVTAELSGAAQQLNLQNGVLSVEKNINLTFSKQSDGKYKATARLLGFASVSPKLTVKITFIAGSPAEIIQSYDLGSQLRTFNGEKNKPFSLSAQLIETPTASGFTTIITDWKTVKEGNATAD